MSTNNTAEQSLQEIWVGLDLGKRTFKAALILGLDRSASGEFATTEAGAKRLIAWCIEQLKAHTPTARLRFVMEATGSYSVRMLTWLLELRPDCAPAIVNPHYIKSFGQSLGVRNKTDKADAMVIARYGQERRPAGDMPKTPEQERLQRLVRERQAIVEELVAEKNRSGEPCDIAEVSKMRKERIALLKKQIKQLERLMRELIASAPGLKRDVALLKTIPGVGFIVAASVLGELGDLRRFAEAKKLSAYCGLSPRQFSSGSSVRRPTRICKMGNKRIRPLLHLAGRSIAGKAKFAYGQLYTDLVARGKTKCAAIAAVARRILVLMRAVLVQNQPYSNYIAGCGQHISKLRNTAGENQCAA